jgi:hypothetical protein
LQDINTPKKFLGKSIQFRLWSFVLFFLASSASFQGFYSANHFQEVGTPGGVFEQDFRQLIEGKAYRPYVYRQMLPEMANWANRVTPEEVKAELYSRLMTNSWFTAMTYSPVAMNETYFFRYLIVYLATFSFALTATFAMYLVCRELRAPLSIAVIAPVVMILLLPYIMGQDGWFYDYSELAFMALAVWVSMRQSWWWLIPIAALGTWNKESFLLFIATLYPFFRSRSSRKSAVAGVAALCLICAIVYLPIHAHFAGNPGVTAEFHLIDQLRYFGNFRQVLISTEEAYGLRLPRAFSALPLLLMVWMVRNCWKSLRPAIRTHAKIAAAINFPLFLIFCNPGELRDLSLLYVALLAVIAANLQEVFSNPDSDEVLAVN